MVPVIRTRTGEILKVQAPVKPMLTVIVTGRNDDYGRNFRHRLFRVSLHNSALLAASGIAFEYVLAEWNPIPDRPVLSEEFVDRVPNARAVIIPREIHQKYSLNPQMAFHEMAAKNAALRRARGEVVLVTNADILFSEDLVARIATGSTTSRVFSTTTRENKRRAFWDCRYTTRGSKTTQGSLMFSSPACTPMRF